MVQRNGERDRLSIDVPSEEHKRIKVYATLHGETIREYVLESVRRRLHQENEGKELKALTMHLDQDPVLRELWDNEKDTGYDKL